MLRTISILLVFCGVSNVIFAQSPDEYIQILQKYRQWKETQYKNKTYAREKDCNVDSILKMGDEGPSTGIPKDIDISFTLINSDNKIDALITFYPVDCDGGNALMKDQVRLLFLSTNSTYDIDEALINKIEKQFSKGWFNINGASNGAFYGDYYEYKDSDPGCCPSIHKSFSLDYKSNKITFAD
jgi:hypothetical protein